MADKLKIFVTKYDDKLYLEDKTDYPLKINGVDYERDQFAIALHYSYSDFLVDNDIDLSNDDSTPLKGGLGDIMSMNFYLIPIYAPGSYSDKQIVYMGDKFYASQIDNNMTTPSPDNQHWVMLIPETALPYLIEHGTLSFPISLVFMYSDIPVLEPYSLNKLLNKEYEIINNTSGLYKVVTKDLYDYENNHIKPISNIFNIEEDGVYKVVITYDIITNNNPGVDPKTSGGMFSTVLIITHMDDIECCYKRMIRSLYCEGSDYCLSKNCFQQREMEYNLNEISNVYNTIIMNMSVSRMKFYNIMATTDTKEKYIQEVGRLMKIIRLAINECKDCCDG